MMMMMMMVIAFVQPITMMRNALGREYGGSGVPLEADKYQASVDYWSKHAIIR